MNATNIFVTLFSLKRAGDNNRLMPLLCLGARQLLILLVGMATAAMVGWFVIKYILKFLRSHSLDVFAYYRFALAAAVILTMMV